ncbi:hypothetical protein Ddye_012052 [Dipteronia dyeriana]|uniref:Uncharacterized protein n=1 Tax=Dipteronia dyeriana TaxID=168575 RepID=A0AAE0CI23_9ROSI|nr:hypothetical protein Ddye_012052 [Dipteronia dyeriana]
MSGLIPLQNQKPKFAQLYIHDTEDEINNRLNCFSSSDTESLDLEIVTALKEMLDQNNILTQSFRYARDSYKEEDFTGVKMRLIRHRLKDGRTYNIPTASEVAALIVRDVDSSIGDKDIIIETQSKLLQHIDMNHPLYLGLQRDNGRTVKKKSTELDNRYVVPYSPNLLLKYQAHINVEYNCQPSAIQYLFKYIHKGNDRVTAAFFHSAPDGDKSRTTDEIQKYYECRYPPVQRLSFHLPQEKSVIFKDSDSIVDIIKKVYAKKSMFEVWMGANNKYEKARNLTYSEFSTKFVYKEDKDAGEDFDGEATIEVPNEKLIKDQENELAKLISSSCPSSSDATETRKREMTSVIIKPTSDYHHSAGRERREHRTPIAWRISVIDMATKIKKRMGDKE